MPTFQILINIFEQSSHFDSYYWIGSYDYNLSRDIKVTTRLL